MKSKSWPAFILVALSIAIPCTAQTDLPDGPGKSTVEKLCSSCHGIATVIGLRRTKEGWQASVDDMVARGATGTDEEFDAAVTYLARFCGKVNVNTAASQELQEVLGIPGEQADGIVKYRTVNGAFKDLEALGKVPGVDAKKLVERKDRIVFQ